MTPQDLQPHPRQRGLAPPRSIIHLAVGLMPGADIPDDNPPQARR